MKLNSKSRTRKIILLTWVIPIVLASPYIFCRPFPFSITSELGTISRQTCNDRFDEVDVAMYGPQAAKSGSFRRGYFIFLFLAIYLIPMILILVTCVKIALCLLQPIGSKRSPPICRKEASRRHEENKRKVARMVMVVAISFIVAWSPQYLVSVTSQLQSLHGVSFLRRSNFLFTMLMTHLAGFVNSCINPFIYGIMSEKFRRSFKQILGSLLFSCCSRRLFRFRDTLRRCERGTSVAYSHTTRQSFTDFRGSEHEELQMSETPSSGNESGCRLGAFPKAGSVRSKDSAVVMGRAGREITKLCQASPKAAHKKGLKNSVQWRDLRKPFSKGGKNGAHVEIINLKPASEFVVPEAAKSPVEMFDSKPVSSDLASAVEAQEDSAAGVTRLPSPGSRPTANGKCVGY